MPYILCGGHTVTTNDDGTFYINVQSPNGKKADYAAYTIGPFGTGFGQAGEYTAQRWDTSDVNQIRFRPWPFSVVKRHSSVTAMPMAPSRCLAIRTARTRDAPAYGGPPTRCPPHSFGTLAQAVALSCSDPTGHSAYETVMPNASVPCVPP